MQQLIAVQNAGELSEQGELEALSTCYGSRVSLRPCQLASWGVYKGWQADNNNNKEQQQRNYFTSNLIVS